MLLYVRLADAVIVYISIFPLCFEARPVKEMYHVRIHIIHIAYPGTWYTCIMC